MVGNHVSHANNKTKRRFEINLLEKKFYRADEDRYVTLKVSAHGLRVINKLGVEEALERAKRNGFITEKGNRVQVILECTEHKESGLPGMSRYITTKNKKNTTDRLELKKYNPVLKKYTVHKEIK